MLKLHIYACNSNINFIDTFQHKLIKFRVQDKETKVVLSKNYSTVHFRMLVL